MIKAGDCGGPSIMDLVLTLPELVQWRDAVVVNRSTCPDDRGARGVTLFIPPTSAAYRTAVNDVPLIPLDRVFEIIVGNATVPLAMPNGTACPAPAPISTPQANAIALFNQLPQGGFSRADLLALGRVRTALDYIAPPAPGGAPWALSFYADADGRTCARPVHEGGTGACITSSHQACDGVLHITDGVFLPVADITALPPVNQTLYDIPPAALDALNPRDAGGGGAAAARGCGSSLLAAVRADPQLTWLAEVLAGSVPPQFLELLGSPAASVSLFAAQNEAYVAASALPGTGLLPTTVAEVRAARDAQGAAPTYLILPQALCPSDLLAAGAVDTAYGRFGGVPASLAFERGPAGGLAVRGASNVSANVVRAVPVCASMLYVVDAWLGVPAEAAAARAANASAPPLTPEQLAVLTNSEAGAAATRRCADEQPSGGGSLSAGAIAGIAVAAAAGAAALAAAAVFVARRRAGRGAGSAGSSGKAAEEGLVGGARFGRQDSGSVASAAGSRDSWTLRPEDVVAARDAAGAPVVLGRGSYGVVTRGTLHGVHDVAIKALAAPVDRAAFAREAELLRSISRCRNIVQFYGVVQHDGALAVVTEMMEVSLRDAIAGDAAGALRWPRAGRAVALDVARGVAFLHANGVVHRDLKSANVLLAGLAGGAPTAKLIDMGMAATLDGASYLSAEQGMAGTFAWAAPELLLGLRCNEKADIFSLGVILWELACRRPPRRGDLAAPAEACADCPENLRDIIARCLEPDPAARPTAREVVELLQAGP